MDRMQMALVGPVIVSSPKEVHFLYRAELLRCGALSHKKPITIVLRLGYMLRIHIHISLTRACYFQSFLYHALRRTTPS
jgi:hypothetical protein